MNNYDVNEKLLNEAKEHYEEMQRAFKRNSWNRTIRRAQEVVELCLKGLLKAVGIEYPKVHDVSGVFARACIQKGIEIDSKRLQEIKAISSDLAEKRAPAFYMEIDYTKQQAEEAMQSAEKVFAVANKLSEDLKG
ncbi:MAG: HEPN domain-containing protein [Candidatus Poribacteria bacterium]